MRSAIAAYIPGSSVIHRLDARAKLAACSLVAVALFVRDSFVTLAVLALAALVGYAFSGLSPRWFWRLFRPLLWLVGLTFVVQLIVTRGQGGIEIGPLVLSHVGIETAVFLSLRLAALVLVGSLLTLTTAPLALTDGLAWYGRPLRRLGLPADEIALTVAIALRFLPTLLVELDLISRAQRARGGDLTTASGWRRVRELPSLLLPLLASSFRRADELALAMEARCYEPGRVRTRLHPLRAGGRDGVFIAVTIAVVAAGLLVGPRVGW